MERTRTIRYEGNDEMLNHVNEMEQSGSWGVRQIIPVNEDIEIGEFSKSLVLYWVVVYEAAGLT